MPNRPANTSDPPPSAAASSGEPVHTRDGRALLLRGIAPTDLAALQRCFKRLSTDDVRRRFLQAMSELPLPMARRLCDPDPDIETALVLIDHRPTPDEIRGVGRIYVDRDAASAEFSVLVEHDWARMGLGALLLGRLVDDCRRRGLLELWGYVLMENRPMLTLSRELGFEPQRALGEPGVTQISLRL